jgi:hypothetical protein
MLDDPPHVELWGWLKSKWKDLTEPKKEEEAPQDAPEYDESESE